MRRLSVRIRWQRLNSAFSSHPEGFDVLPVMYVALALPQSAAALINDVLRFARTLVLSVMKVAT